MLSLSAREGESKNYHPYTLRLPEEVIGQIKLKPNAEKVVQDISWTVSDCINQYSNKSSLSVGQEVSYSASNYTSFSYNASSLGFSEKIELSELSDYSGVFEKLYSILKSVGENEVLSEEDRLYLVSSLQSSHPGLAILNDINEGSEFYFLIFDGIKHLNTLFGMSLVDQIVAEFKDAISTQTGEISAWSDYKNYLSNSELDIDYLNGLFLNILSKYASSDIIEGIKERFNVVVAHGKMPEDFDGDRQMEIFYNLGEVRSKAESSLNNDIVPIEGISAFSNDLREKYSDYYAYTDQGEFFEEDDVEGNVIIEARGGNFKFYSGIDNNYKRTPIVTEFNIWEENDEEGFPVVNPEFIYLVGKRKIPDNSTLFKDFNKLRSSVICASEFILPVEYRESSEGRGEEFYLNDDLARFSRVRDEILENGKVSDEDRDYVLELSATNFKGGINYNVLPAYINPGSVVGFVDFKGTGAYNISNDMRNIHKFNAGKITKKEMMMSSGEDMTNRIKSSISELFKKYEGKAYYCLKGDEFYPIVKSSSDADEFFGDMDEILERNGLKFRSVVSSPIEDNAFNTFSHSTAIDLLKKIDIPTGNLKALEERLESMRGDGISDLNHRAVIDGDTVYIEFTLSGKVFEVRESFSDKFELVDGPIAHYLDSIGGGRGAARY